MMKNLMLLVVLAAAACGSKNKNTTEESGVATIDPSHSTGDSTDRSHEQIDPVKMDEVNQLLERKRQIMSRCLSTAVEAGNAPKNARGKVTVGIKINGTGKVTSVEVIKASIESKEVHGCVLRKIEEMTFPEMGKPFETSFTYAMETN